MKSSGRFELKYLLKRILFIWSSGLNIDFTCSYQKVVFRLVAGDSKCFYSCGFDGVSKIKEVLRCIFQCPVMAGSTVREVFILTDSLPDKSLKLRPFWTAFLLSNSFIRRIHVTRTWSEVDGPNKEARTSLTSIFRGYGDGTRFINAPECSLCVFIITKWEFMTFSLPLWWRLRNLSSVSYMQIPWIC